MPDKVYNSVAIAIKDFFELTAQEVTAEYKKLTAEDKIYFEEHLEKVGFKFSEKN